MSEQALSPQELKAIMQAEGIKNPVLATRVVGGRVELHLLGGAVILAPSPQAAKEDAKHDQTEHGQTEPGQTEHGQTEHGQTEHDSVTLEVLTVDQLRQVAADLGMSGYSRLRKQQLIDALLDRFTSEELAEAIRS